MAITSTITSSAGSFTNVSPIPFSIVFSAAVTGFTISDLVVTGGTIISFSGSGATYNVSVSPTSQGSIVSLQVPAAVATGPGPAFESNAESNTITSQFLSIKPRVTIEHELTAITNSQNLKIDIVFDKDVTGFTANDFAFVNAALYSLTGSGAVYNAIITPNKIGQVEFWVNADAGTDSYGNTSVKSNAVTLMFDPTSFDDKEDAVEGEVTDPEILLDFELTELSQVAEITSLADCAKTIPQRLLQLAQDKAYQILSQNEDVKKLAANIAIVQKNVETIKAIVDQVHGYIENPTSLMQDILDSQGLTGEALRQKTQEITDKFSAVSGLDSIIAAAKATGICDQTDYYADGSFAPKQTLTPTDLPPSAIPGVVAGVSTNTYDSTAKDKYDQFSFDLKEQLELDSSEEQSSDRAQMMSLLTTLVMGYHDGISKTTDSSKDAELFDKYSSNVESEKTRNAGWPSDIKTSFSNKTSMCGDIIKRNVDVIRAFYNRNSPSGSAISVGVTTYSGPADDFTTFLDIKPEQRPAELTAKYKAEGKTIPTGSTYTNSKGKTIKIGTLDYADAFTGAYGKTLVSDKSCASTRFPGGSIISLRNSDGTPYDPTGKNPSGEYHVDDTGNAELTWKKPDIFTLTPEKYTGMDSVQVFLVSKGSQVNGSQYQLAQKTYGSGNVA